MAAERVLIVEDDRELGDLLRQLLEREGFDVRVVTNGREMDTALTTAPADIIVLDIMLPGEDGISICRRLRAAGPTAVLMLTARTDEIDRIIGLEIGADDYLGKPFHPRELLARMRAILRRTDAAGGAQIERQATGQIFIFEGFRFEADARRLLKGEEEIDLSTGDFDLLLAFVTHPQRLLTRDYLMDLTKGRSWDVYDRSIDVALSRLRRKLDDDAARPALIRTVRGAGYMFTAAVRRA
ncbi:response regulator [Parvibaculum sp.]|uniref:response regulator n=1 Tax=Parvibaculum sp. TaxID=2024848 RepID=UPI00391D324F